MPSYQITESKITQREWLAMRDAKVIEKGINPITGAEYSKMIAHVFGETEAQQAHNALLITAAPKMYKALKEIKQIIGGCAYRQSVKEQVIAGKCHLALAKAEGK